MKSMNHSKEKRKEGVYRIVSIQKIIFNLIILKGGITSPPSYAHKKLKKLVESSDHRLRFFCQIILSICMQHSQV